MLARILVVPAMLLGRGVDDLEPTAFVGHGYNGRELVEQFRTTCPRSSVTERQTGFSSNFQVVQGDVQKLA